MIASTHCEEQNGWNEQSLRYTKITDKNEFYIPKRFRQQSSDNKQLGIGEVSNTVKIIAEDIYKDQCEQSYTAYTKLINMGVCREQARGVLVPSIYVNWVWTASLQSILNFLDLRLGEGAQLEISQYALAIEGFCKQHFPNTMIAWKKYH